MMAYSCITCARRKVKCDKISPACARCSKGKVECSYKAPEIRPRKRKQSDELLEKIARYESILAKHGLLNGSPTSPNERSPQEEAFLNSVGPEESRTATGTLLASQGKSRYIESHIWQSLGDEEMRHISEDEDSDDELETLTGAGNCGSIAETLDPLTGAFLDIRKDLLSYHPSHTMAMTLWQTYADNIEPLCKALHTPTTREMLERVSMDPQTASKREECLLFAIYHAATFSMTEEQCANQLGSTRLVLMERYHFAARQALVNASFLKTTEMAVLQGFFLLLLTSRYFYDPHTYWMLTGNLLRIALRMGLHRDAEKLGLPPFEVEMRRRLFYQVFPMDSRASQLAGTEMPSLPDSWDTRHPLNINDDQIWPGMTESPEEQQGPTDMTFHLMRASVGLSLARTGKPNCIGPGMKEKGIDAEPFIAAAEQDIENRFIRYCDITNPLHFLGIGLARSGITAMRLKVRLDKLRDQSASDAERQECFQLAHKTLDTDAAVHANRGLSHFRWYTEPFFLWGTWDSLIIALSTIWKRSDILSTKQIDAAWKSIEELYKNHNNLMVSKVALHTAFRRFTLKAWNSHPPSNSFPEPAFIVTLRSLQERREKSSTQDGISQGSETDIPSPSWLSSANYTKPPLEFDQLFELDADDWEFWNNLIQDQHVL